MSTVTTRVPARSKVSSVKGATKRRLDRLGRSSAAIALVGLRALPLPRDLAGTLVSQTVESASGDFLAVAWKWALCCRHWRLQRRTAVGSQCCGCFRSTTTRTPVSAADHVARVRFSGMGNKQSSEPAPLSAAEHGFVVGDRVQTQWTEEEGGNDQWYPGTVSP